MQEQALLIAVQALRPVRRNKKIHDMSQLLLTPPKRGGEDSINVSNIAGAAGGTGMGSIKIACAYFFLPWPLIP